MSLPFIGHQKQWELLISDVTHSRLAPMYLFYGLMGIGKSLVALTWAQFLFCTERKQNLIPCGNCASCTRIKERKHPDFFEIEPEENRTEIRIDQIRALKPALYRAPLEASYQIVLLPQAHLLNQAASNSFLKMLEEPPRNALFILVSTNLFKILPTIRSRARRIFFKAPPLTHLCSLYPEKILKITEGSLGLAQKYQDETYQKALESFDSFRNQGRGFKEVVSLSSQWAQSDMDLNLLLQAFKKRVFDEMQESWNYDLLADLDLLSESQKNVGRRVNAQLILENMLMSLSVTGQHGGGLYGKNT